MFGKERKKIEKIVQRVYGRVPDSEADLLAFARLITMGELNSDDEAITMRAINKLAREPLARYPIDGSKYLLEEFRAIFEEEDEQEEQTSVTLKEQTLFATPNSFKSIEDWIMRHNGDEQIHLWTAAMMLHNLMVKVLVTNYEVNKK